MVYHFAHMRKETVIAIILGSALGIALVFGVWRANQAFNTKKVQKEQQTFPTPSKPPSTPEKEAKNLVITSPENNIVVNQDTIRVEGTTDPKATVVIISNLNEVIMSAGKDGTFAYDVKLEGGANEIKVVSYDKNGKKSEKILTVVYSTEFPPKEEE